MHLTASFACVCHRTIYCITHAPWVTPPPHHGSRPHRTMGHAPTAPWVTSPPHHGSCPHRTMGHAPTAPWFTPPPHHGSCPHHHGSCPHRTGHRTMGHAPTTPYGSCAHRTMGHAPTAPWFTPPPHHGSCPHHHGSCPHRTGHRTMGHAPTTPYGSCAHRTMVHAPTTPYGSCPHHTIWFMPPLHHNIVPCNPQATFSFDAVCGSMTCRMSSTSWPTAFPTAPRSITKLRGTFEDTSSCGTWVRFFRCMHACTGHASHDDRSVYSAGYRIVPCCTAACNCRLTLFPMALGYGK